MQFSTEINQRNFARFKTILAVNKQFLPLRKKLVAWSKEIQDINRNDKKKNQNLSEECGEIRDNFS